MMISKVTRRGQTTLPRAVREALHLSGGEHLSYEITSDGVLVRAQPGAASAYGMLTVPEHLRGLEFKKARAMAHDRVAEAAAREGLK